MTSKPILTVITVVRNAATVIERTLQSVVGQTAFGNIEYIVVDGASTDATLDIAARYRDQIDTLVSEPDHGIYDAMNKGVRLASTPWVVFMNAGDTFYDADTVASLGLDRREAGHIVYGDHIVVTSSSTTLARAYPFFSNPDKCSGIGICHQAIYTPTRLLRQQPFDFSVFHYCCDYAFYFMQWHRGVCFDYVARPLCYYEWGTGFSSTPEAHKHILDENARISGTKYGYYYWIHVARDWKRKLKERYAHTAV